MVNKPNRDVKAAWWLTSAYCDTCRKYLRKHHMSRHVQSATHQRLKDVYDVMASDRAFTRFLENVRGVDFIGAEGSIYGLARYRFWADPMA